MGRQSIVVVRMTMTAMGMSVAVMGVLMPAVRMAVTPVVLRAVIVLARMCMLSGAVRVSGVSPVVRMPEAGRSQRRRGNRGEQPADQADSKCMAIHQLFEDDGGTSGNQHSLRER